MRNMEVMITNDSNYDYMNDNNKRIFKGKESGIGRSMNLYHKMTNITNITIKQEKLLLFVKYIKSTEILETT